MADEHSGDDGENDVPREPGRMQRLANANREGANLKALLDAYERELIQSALSACRGNQRRAAATLGLLPTTLHEKMKRLGMLRRPLPLDEDGHVGSQ
jgi:DNA-binding NtrC family response regulator